MYGFALKAYGQVSLVEIFSCAERKYDIFILTLVVLRFWQDICELTRSFLFASILILSYDVLTKYGIHTLKVVH
jgi:hypothetical protein